MRLFAGIPIVDDARREIVALLGSLRDTGWPVRWVHDEGLHLTLKFFGEVAPERLEVIEEAVRFAGQGTGPLALRLARSWRVSQRSAAARALDRHRRAAGAGAAAGPAGARRRRRSAFRPEGTPFQPHVTLGRVREGHRLPPRGLEDFGDAYAPAPFVGGHLVLYESVLTTQGPRYEARLTLELSA